MLKLFFDVLPAIIKEAPEAISLFRKYEPQILAFGEEYGPTLEAWFAKEQEAGTLEQSISKIVANAQAAIRIYGGVGSFADIAELLGSIQPAADIGNPQEGQHDVTGSRAR